MIDLLNLIRWKNLLLLALTQVLIKYALLDPQLGATTSLDSFGFALLLIATICIAAAGYVVNDIYDIETDSVNKPDKLIVTKGISEKNAFTLFIILNIIGVGTGFYLSNWVGNGGLAAVFVIISALLYVYASYLKQMLIIGNIVVSLLVGMSLIVVGIFELLPAIAPDNQATQITFFELILDYAIFAVIINLIREIVKDLEDIEGDYKADMKTLPIVIGRERTRTVVTVLSFLPMVAVVYYVITFLYKQELAVAYFALFIIAPLLYFSVKSFSAESKKDWQHLSAILKMTMFFGVLSMLLFKYILLN